VNGPRQWANPKLFEAIRPSFWDLVSKPVYGSKSSYKGVKRGYAKVSLLLTCYVSVNTINKKEERFENDKE
jgi:hypothetical protein